MGRSNEMADVLEQRLIDFAVRVIRLAAALPRSPAGKHIAGQILRCGTSPAPHYGEARSAESRADFLHKLKLILKELNETSIWLRIILKAEIVAEPLLIDLVAENKELCRVVAKSVVTSRSRAADAGRSASPNDK